MKPHLVVLKVIGLIPTNEAIALIKKYRNKTIDTTAIGYNCDIKGWTFIYDGKYGDYFYYKGSIYVTRHVDGYALRLDAVW